MRWPLPSVCLLVAACARPTPRAVPPVPLPARTAAAAAPAAVASPSAAAESAPVAAANPPSPPPSGADAAPPAPAMTLFIEPPYSALGHATLATEMLTLGRDEELFQWALGGSSDPAHPGNQSGYHPATRVVVDVELLSRAPKGSTKRLQRIARSNGYWPLRACFEQAQRVAPRAERTARARLTLSAFGKVLGSRSLGKASEPDYARCVLGRLRGLDFTPGFTRKLDIEISVKQWPGHAPVPPRAPAATAALQSTPELRAALEALRPRLVGCYEQGLTSDPKLWGRLALQLGLTEDASVSRADQTETKFPSPEVVECARQAVLGAHLVTTSRELTVAFRFGQPPAPPAPAPPSEGVPASPPAPPAPAPPVPPEPLPPAPSH